jgi:CRISPR-associated protein Csb2
VNEGIVEWPPSPWRLLRALIAGGYTKLGWTEIPPHARRLFESLADALPSYRLPPATLAHSRHFMPVGSLERGREKTTLVFDTWANVGDGLLAVRWPCSLDAEAERLLGELATNLGYLGRSESWVAAELVSDESPLPPGTDAWPADERRPGEPGWEQVSLLGPERPQAYAAWRQEAVRAALVAAPIGRRGAKNSKKLDATRVEATAAYPADLLDCLQRDTGWWKEKRWNQPPGSRRVLYWRRAGALSVGAPAPAAHRAASSVTMMLLALTTESGSRSPLPPISRALAQAELLQRALVGHVRRRSEAGCPELTGRDANGERLLGHQHAHFLPIDLDGDQHLDHVLIYAPMGLGPEAQSAIRGIKRTPTKGGVGALRVALAGEGDIEDLRRLPAHLRGGVEQLLGPSAGARIWRSITPCVLPRHAKRRGKNTLDGQLRAEIASRGLPSALVEILPWREDTRALRHFQRVRRPPAPPPPSDLGVAIQITFEYPVRGPISLGYGSHHGLGLLQATEGTSELTPPPVV